jgi:hypothetical protein
MGAPAGVTPQRDYARFSSLEDIGKKLHLNKGQVYHILKSALGKMRRNPRLRELMDACIERNLRRGEKRSTDYFNTFTGGE